MTTKPLTAAFFTKRTVPELVTYCQKVFNLQETPMTDNTDNLSAGLLPAETKLNKPYVVRLSLQQSTLGEIKTSRRAVIVDEDGSEDEDEDDIITPRAVGMLYSYLTDLDLEIGDLVVVEVPSKSLAVARVGEICQHDARATKWVVSKVDVDKYVQRVLNMRKAAELKKALDKKVKAMDEDLRMQMYADKDANFKVMLDEYKALQEQLK